MKIHCLLISTCLMTVLCAAEEMTIWVQLEKVVDERPEAVASRKHAVFKSGRLYGFIKTFKVPLYGHSKDSNKNTKNILRLIQQFPKESVRTDKGLEMKPKGTLRFKVPLTDPENKIKEWELAEMIIKEKAEP